MAIPVTTDFDSFDWNPRHASTSHAGDLSLTNVPDGLLTYLDKQPSSMVATADYLSISANAEKMVTSQVVESLAQAQTKIPAIGSSFSFEFDLLLTPDIPLDFSDDGNRLFVGVTGSGGYAAGFLFSYQGVALAASPSAPASILAGSADFLFDSTGAPNTGVTVRAVCSEGVLSLYLTKTTDGYVSTNGASWADLLVATKSYELPAPVADVAYGDSLVIYASAQSANKLNSNTPGLGAVTGQTVLALLGSARLSTSVLTPPTLPTATIQGASQVVVNTPITLQGGSSTDANGLEVTHIWEITVKPKGSNARLGGAAYSEVTIGTALGQNEVLIQFREATETGDDYSFVFTKDTVSGGALGIALSGTQVSVTLPIDAGGSVTATAYDFIKAMSVPQVLGYNSAVAALFTVDLAGQDGGGVLVEGTYQLTGGAGSTFANPVFIPDIAGGYVISLRVDNGLLKSTATTLDIKASTTPQLLEHAPTGEFVFDYISDFWKLVEDREVLSTFWSTLMQVVSADLLIAWENDYAKALRDISRKYQRRWLQYFFQEDLSAATLVFPTDAKKVVVNPTIVTAGSHSGTATYVGVQNYPPVDPGFVLLRSSNHAPAVVQIVLVEDLASNGNWTITAAGESFPYYKIVTSNTAGYYVKDPLLAYVSPTESDIFTSKTYSLADVTTANKIRLKEATGNTLLTISALNPKNVPNSVEVSATGVIDQLRWSWDLLEETSDVETQATPYWQMPAGTDLSDYAFGLGDYAELLVVDPYTGEELEVHVPVVAVTADKVFVDWQPLLAVLGAVASVQAVPGQQTTWSENDLAALSITLKTVSRHQKSQERTDLVGVAALGGITASLFLENKDHVINDDRVEMISLLEGTVTVTANSAVVAITTTSTHEDITLTAGIESLVEAGLTTLVIGEGDAGTYLVVGSTNTGDLILDRAPGTAGTFPCWASRFSYANPAAERYWAEVSFFDNWATIQSHYGVLVGIPKAVVDAYVEGVDYLSLVKGVWFAFMSGPSLGNIELAVQAMFGLPYAEEAAQVTAIVDATTTTDGYFVLAKSTGEQLVQYFPYGSVIATNPATNRTIQAFPLTEDETALSAAKSADLADSKVAAYTKLVDVMRVEDYISDPDLVANRLPGQEILKKYHTFFVDIPLKITKTTEITPLVKTFLERAKPAHTNFILTAVLALGDTLTYSEKMVLKPTLRLRDTPHTSPFFALKDGPAEAGKATVSAAEEIKLWPNDQTFKRMMQLPGTVTAINAFNVIVTTADLSAYLDITDPTLEIIVESDVVGGTETFTFNAVSATQIQMDTNYLGSNGTNLKIWGPWQQADVKECYESGYSEGIVDDWSGDGSWNTTQSQLDMVNQWDSDIDVVNSRMWVPVTKSTAGGQDLIEFLPGEEILLYENGVEAGTIWEKAPPVLLHIGSGVHPKLPFGVLSPQNEHPETYVILGFENRETTADDWTVVMNYGNEARLSILDERGTAVGFGGAGVTLVGKQSGAIATPVVAGDMYDVADAHLFHIEYIFAADKLTEWGPKVSPKFIATKFIPVPGMLVSDFEVYAGPPAKNTVFSPVAHPNYQRQVDEVRYNPLTADIAQFVPSFGPGAYTQWDLTLESPDNPPGVPPAAKTDYYMRWGYTPLPGYVSANNTAITAFTPVTGMTALQNVHYGMTVLARKEEHYTHGITTFEIPAPEIALTIDLGGGLLRVEGWYFVDYDVTQTVIPSVNPADGGPYGFDGTVGGCWMFVRNAAGTEFAMTAVAFTTGLAGGPETVLGLDATVQTRTGHVLVGTLPALAPGVYDVVVRNYRPYIMKAAGSTLYHMDESVFTAGYTEP